MARPYPAAASRHRSGALGSRLVTTRMTLLMRCTPTAHVAAALALTVTGCARCAGERSARSAEELLPQAAQGSAVTAPLAGVARNVSALVERAGQLPGGEQLRDGRRAVSAQLGFDPFTRDGLLSAGLDPDRGAALVLLEGQPPGWVAALPLTGQDAFARTFDRVARERAGLAVRTDEARGDVRVALYSRVEAGERIALGFVRGYAVLSRGADPAAQVAEAAARKPEQSLARDERLSAARQQLGGQDLTVLAPAGSGLLRRITSRPLPGDLGIGVTGTAAGVAARLFFQAPPQDAGSPPMRRSSCGSASPPRGRSSRSGGFPSCPSSLRSSARSPDRWLLRSFRGRRCRSISRLTPISGSPSISASSTGTAKARSGRSRWSRWRRWATVPAWAAPSTPP